MKNFKVYCEFPSSKSVLRVQSCSSTFVVVYTKNPRFCDQLNNSVSDLND